MHSVERIIHIATEDHIDDIVVSNFVGTGSHFGDFLVRLYRPVYIIEDYTDYYDEYYY